MRVEDLFEAGAFDAIEAAVREAERSTAGEIVPTIVERSSGYSGVRAAGAALLAFGAGVIVLAWTPHAWIWLPPVQVLAFALGYLALGSRHSLRHLIPPRIREAAVDAGARRAFLEHGVFETRDRTGILIYVSLLEHRVEVLADRGIDGRVEPGTWNGVVERILKGIRERRAEEGLINAIHRCGEILAHNPPPHPDDPNELPNHPRTND